MAAPRTLSFAVLTGFFVAFAAPVQAQATKEAQARIGPTTASSACIGTSNTPTCAAETLLACLARNDEALCRRVGATLPAPSRADTAPAPSLVEYAIERVSVIRPEDITDDTRDLDWFKPGYSLVEVSRRSCPADSRDCADASWEYVQIYLRPAGAQWQVVNWRGEGDDDTAPEPPEGLGRDEPAH